MEADQSSCNHRITESRLNNPLHCLSSFSVRLRCVLGESGEQGMESRCGEVEWSIHGYWSGAFTSGEVEWSIHGYWSGAFTSDRELLFHCLV
ncbi:hypothetical protein F2Q70_00044429 [Brassica cretica]|uniref:Uncharacterized protein n=1 Tax=Brassica cretica TaxID=69181 RepID=A0A8S9KI97_BRACR|nr:hypothetical protein F2Q70_00044429 [Brassica cretica]